MTDGLTPAEQCQLAWEHVFSGNGSRDDVRLVLRDLMGVTGFYSIAGPRASADDLKYLDGQRSVYLALLLRIEGSDTATQIEREARMLRPATG